MWLQFISVRVCVVGVQGWWGEWHCIIWINRMFLLITCCVYVCVRLPLKNANDRLHVINNMGPVMERCSAEVSKLSVRQLDFHTQPGGWKGSQKPIGGEGGGVREGRPERQRGLLPQPFVHNSSLCFKGLFSHSKNWPRGEFVNNVVIWVVRHIYFLVSFD